MRERTKLSQSEQGIRVWRKKQLKCLRKSVEYGFLCRRSMPKRVVGRVPFQLIVSTPNAVKALLMITAQHMPNEIYIEEGGGLLNIKGSLGR